MDNNDRIELIEVSCQLLHVASEHLAIRTQWACEPEAADDVKNTFFEDAVNDTCDLTRIATVVREAGSKNNMSLLAVALSDIHNLRELLKDKVAKCLHRIEDVYRKYNN